MEYDGPFSWMDLDLFTDETLPPEHVKFLVGDKVRVFQLDLEKENAIKVAEWPEHAAKKP